MNPRLRMLTAGILSVLMFFSLLSAPGTRAEAVETAASEAAPLTDFSVKFGSRTAYSAASTPSVTLEYSGGIGSLYFVYYIEYGAYTIINNDTGESAAAGQGNFLHDFVDLVELFGTAPTSVTISWDVSSVRLNEMYIFTAGDTVPDDVENLYASRTTPANSVGGDLGKAFPVTPTLPLLYCGRSSSVQIKGLYVTDNSKASDYVQIWEMPVEDKTDLILFSTHGDDEQLFFAGILPYYANALDYQVQVVYLTNHRNNSDQRQHEMLNGLWAVGCTTYPVFGTFQDFLYSSKTKTYEQFQKQGVTRDDIIEYCVEQIRRFKPLVVIAHDFAGEYGHGQHMVYADCVAAALEISNDASYYPESAEAYGVWDVPKAYFHLYEENQITMDWDTPMEELDGMTPFEVTQQLGFPCHESQQWTWFYKWINGKETAITKASEIATYSPCLYGLYRTTVGLDVEGNDFFENLTTYEEQERIAAEEAAAKAAEESAGSTQTKFPKDLKAIRLTEEYQPQTETATESIEWKGILQAIGIGLALTLLGIVALYFLWQECMRRIRRKRRPRPKMENLEK